MPIDDLALFEFRTKAEELLDRANGLVQNSTGDLSEVLRIVHVLHRAAEMMGLTRSKTQLSGILALLTPSAIQADDRTTWLTHVLKEISQCRNALYDEPLSETESPPAALGNVLPLASPQARTRVLIVDDDPELRDLIQDQLSGAGYEVLALGRPEEVLDSIVQFQPQLVVTDFTMPRMSGLDLIRQIRLTFADLPVIVLSGALDKAKLMALMPCQVAATCEKPWDKKEFLALCDAVVTKPRPLQLLSRALDIILGQIALAPTTPEQVPELEKEITRLFQECIKLGPEEKKA